MRLVYDLFCLISDGLVKGTGSLANTERVAWGGVDPGVKVEANTHELDQSQ